MYRNTTLPNQFQTSYISQQGRSSLSKTGNTFIQSRSPLYPIGPTITHKQQFSHIRRAPSPSPYLTNKQSFQPPSYQKKYLQTSMGFVDRYQVNYEEREKRIIERNQIEIQEEHKKREGIRVSYEREIQNVKKVLMRNMERKQKLLLQIQALQATNRQFHQKLSTLAPPKQSINLYEPLDRKQHDIIVTKNRLLNSIRQKQQESIKQQQQQEQYWQNQIKQKEKILLSTQEQIQKKRIQLKTNNTSIQKPDFIAIQDQVRDAKYQDFIYEAQMLQNKIAAIIKDRQTQQRQVQQALKTKRQTIHLLELKHYELNRQRTTSRIRSQQLQRVSRQMQSANDNLLKQLQRKQNMIQKYQLDIYTLKQRKDQQQRNLHKMMNDARENEAKQMEENINEQILKVQEEIRYESGITNKLKSQYQKIYQILCSTASKNIHETFNSTLMV